MENSSTLSQSFDLISKSSQHLLCWLVFFFFFLYKSVSILEQKHVGFISEIHRAFFGDNIHDCTGCCVDSGPVDDDMIYLLIFSFGRLVQRA